jgi:hypothetical protein
MKYLLLICVDGPVTVSAEESSAEAWVKEMDGRGVRLFGDRLRPARDATGVQIRADKLLITDGPYAEAHEHIGGFDVIECADLDEAIEVASKHPVARFGTVEVRPFWVD